MTFYYLLINLFCILGPLSLSFDKRVAYYRNWPSVFVSILCTCLLFVPVDAFFTAREIWGFNNEFLTGKWIFGIPVEEFLFFVTVPFACVFVYECVISYLPNLISRIDKKISIYHLLIFNAATLTFTFAFRAHFYSMTVAVAALIVVNTLAFMFRNYLAKSILSFAFIIIPFLLVNGALTGMFTEKPVVWYESSSISEIRIGTIPIEDIFYNILLISSSFFFYLGFKAIVLKPKTQKT